MGPGTIAVLVSLGLIIVSEATKIIISLIGNKKYKESLKHMFDNEPQTLDSLSSDEKTVIANEKEMLQNRFGGEHPGEKLSQMEFEDRKKLVLDFSKDVLAQYGLSEVDVIFTENSGFNGYYSITDKKLYIDELYLRDDNKYILLDVIDTVLHETRHAYQYATVENGTNTLNTETEAIKEWAINMANYIRPEIDPQGYHEQPIEVDARGWSAGVLHMYLRDNNLLEPDEK